MQTQSLLHDGTVHLICAMQTVINERLYIMRPHHTLFPYEGGSFKSVTPAPEHEGK